MGLKQGLGRRAHFVGTKIKSLRKRNHLTLEDLSVRCIQLDAEAGPSVSYLSMIENGKRVPSVRTPAKYHCGYIPERFELVL